MVNRGNYKLTREFLDFLKEVKQLRSESVGRYKAYLNHFLIWLDDTKIEKCVAKRPSFPSFLSTHRLDSIDYPLVPDTQKKIIQTTKRFLKWLKMCYPTRFKNLPLVWVESLQPVHTINKPREHEYVSLDDVKKLATTPTTYNEIICCRDQAAVAMLFHSGMRSSAFATLPIEAVDVSNLSVKQWPSLGVLTKNRKHATTYLLSIPELIAVVQKWDIFVRETLPPEAMWYPPIKVEWDKMIPLPDKPGKHRNIALAKRIKKLSQETGVPYKSPHKFRHGHAVFALMQARTMADYKAISQNLMHDNIKVTDSVYAWMKNDEVRQRIVRMSDDTSYPPIQDDELEAYLNGLSKSDLKQAIILGANLLAG